MDMMSTLSLQMMQLSDDPEDLTPVRWYWCQPGAEPITWPTVFGFGLWDDERRNPRVGPQIHMFVDKYRADEVSPYPGTDQYGLQDWWENGLPPDARGGSETDLNAGTERWDSQVQVNGEFFVQEGAHEELAGGSSGGGPLRMRGGVTLRLTGGSSGGGPIAMASPCRIWYGGCDHLTGGSSGGGPIEMVVPPMLETEGGSSGGGPIEMRDECLDVPTFVEGQFEPASLSNSLTMSFPDGTAAGDVVILAFWHHQPLAAFEWPEGWHDLSTFGVNGILIGCEVRYRRYSDDDGPDFTLSWGTPVLRAGCVVSVTGAADPIAGGSVGTDNEDPWFANGLDGGPCPYLLLAVLGITDETAAMPDADGMTSFGGDGPQSPVWIYHEEPAGPGESGTRGGEYPLTDNWGSVIVICFPG